MPWTEGAGTGSQWSPSARWALPPTPSPYQSLAPSPRCWGDSLVTHTDTSGHPGQQAHSTPSQTPPGLNGLPLVPVSRHRVRKLRSSRGSGAPAAPPVPELHRRAQSSHQHRCSFPPVEDELRLLPSISFVQVISLLQFPLAPKRATHRSVRVQFQSGRGKGPGRGSRRRPVSPARACAGSPTCSSCRGQSSQLSPPGPSPARPRLRALTAVPGGAGRGVPARRRTPEANVRAVACLLLR